MKRLLFIILLVVQAVPSLAKKRPPRFTLLFTGDTAGKLKPDYNGWGGISKRARVIRRIRRKKKNVLLVDIGDFLSPDYIAIKSEGQVVTDLMTRLRYDVVTLGNHEFDFGPDILKQRIEELVINDVMVVGTNLTTKDNKDFVYPAVVESLTIHHKKARVLFLGVVDPASVPLAGSYELKLNHIQKSLNAALAAYQDSTIDFTVCLAHVRRGSAVWLAEKNPRIDLFICLGVGSSATEIKALEITDVTSHHSTMVVNASRFAYNLGRVDVIFHEGWKDITISSEPIDDAVPPDPIIKQEVFIEDTKANYPIFRITPEQNHPDTLIAMVLKLIKDRSRSEIAILNKGMFNFKAMPFKGENQVTYNDLFEFIWVSDNLVRLKLPGHLIYQLFKQSAAQNREHPGSSYLYVDGYDPQKRLINNKVMQEHDLYTVVTNDFLAGGGDDYTIFRDKGRQKKSLFLEKPNYLDPSAKGRPMEMRNDVVIPGFIAWQSSDRIRVTDLSRRPTWKLDLKSLGMALYQSWWNTDSESYTSIPDYPEQDLLQIDANLFLVISRLGALGTWKNEADFKYGTQKYIGKDIYEKPDDAKLTSRFEFLELFKIPLSSQVFFPFTQIRYDTEFAPDPGQLREMKLYEDLGLGYKYKNLKHLRISVGVVNDLADKFSRAGIALSWDSLYQQKLNMKKLSVVFINRIKYFGDLTEEKDIHRWYIYNTFAIPLVKNINLHSAVNWYNYWDDQDTHWATAIDYRLSLNYHFHARVQRY